MLRRTGCFVLALLASWTLSPTPSAHATWTTTSPGAGAQAATTMPVPPAPTVTTANVLGVGYVYTLSWPTTLVHSTTPVTGYRITRASQSGSVLTLGTCSRLTILDFGVRALEPVTPRASQQSCTDIAVLPMGQVRYTVTPVYGNWTGAPSAPSAPVN